MWLNIITVCSVQWLSAGGPQGRVGGDFGRPKPPISKANWACLAVCRPWGGLRPGLPEPPCVGMYKDSPRFRLSGSFLRWEGLFPLGTLWSLEYSRLGFPSCPRREVYLVLGKKRVKICTRQYIPVLSTFGGTRPESCEFW